MRRGGRRHQYFDNARRNTDKSKAALDNVSDVLLNAKLDNIRKCSIYEVPGFGHDEKALLEREQKFINDSALSVKSQLEESNQKEYVESLWRDLFQKPHFDSDEVHLKTVNTWDDLKRNFNLLFEKYDEDDPTFLEKLCKLICLMTMKPAGPLIRDKNSMLGFPVLIGDKGELNEYVERSPYFDKHLLVLSVDLEACRDSTSWKTIEADVISQVREKLNLDDDVVVTLNEKFDSGICRLKNAIATKEFTDSLMDVVNPAVLLVIEKDLLEGETYYIASIPGGSRRLGESTQDNAKRKFLEETGVSIESLSPTSEVINHNAEENPGKSLPFSKFLFFRVDQA